MSLYRKDDVAVQEGRDDDHSLLRASCCNVQTPSAARRQDRTKTHGKISGPILPVRDGDDDHIPLVALDAFEIFNEKSLLPACIEELGQLGAAVQLPIQRALNSVGMLDAHGDYAQRKVRGRSCMLKNQFHNLSDLAYGAFLLSIRRRDIVHMHMRDCSIRSRAWKCHEAIVVHVMVRKRYEGFIVASVMPVQVKSPHERDHHIQQAFVTRRIDFCIILFFCGCKERRRWKLLDCLRPR